MLKKFINLFKSKESFLPSAANEEQNSRLIFGKSKNPPIIEIIAETVTSKIDLDSYLKEATKEEAKLINAKYKAFKKAAKTAGRHKGVEAQRNNAKILDFISFLVNKNYLIKIKK
tara:strand:- start:21090 stop:21434 length:345 start_codon:yes stop_codon:yes gene_type:complete